MKRILIIEDEPEMLRNLAMILRLEGYPAGRWPKRKNPMSSSATS